MLSQAQSAGSLSWGYLAAQGLPKQLRGYVSPSGARPVMLLEGQVLLLSFYK